MALLDSLNHDLKTALKAGQHERVMTLRFVLAQLQNRQKQKQGEGKDPALSDEEVVEVLQKEAKKRRESITLFEQGGREDLAKKENEELAVISAYLPAAMSEVEIEMLVDACIAEGLSEFGAVMKEVMKRSGGRAPGQVVSALVKKKLS